MLLIFIQKDSFYRKMKNNICLKFLYLQGNYLCWKFVYSPKLNNTNQNLFEIQFIL